MWDYWSLNPESLQVLILMSDRRTHTDTATWTTMVVTPIRCWTMLTSVLREIPFQNGAGEFHEWRGGTNESKWYGFSQRDLMENIDAGNFPQWNLKIQVMTEEQANSQDYYMNPFDVTSLASRRLSVNRCGSFRTESEPHNYFGYWASGIRARTYRGRIGYSPDKMLQARILSYPDAQRYRLGTNYEQIPVNRCFATNNYQRDGQCARTEMEGKPDLPE
jgi:catalase